MKRKEPMTVKELYELAEALVKDGYGDKEILISDDEEGNGYHKVWYDFTIDEGSIMDCIDITGMPSVDPKKVVILG